MHESTKTFQWTLYIESLNVILRKVRAIADKTASLNEELINHDGKINIFYKNNIIFSDLSPLPLSLFLDLLVRNADDIAYQSSWERNTKV